MANPDVFAKTFAPVKTQTDAIVLSMSGEPTLCALHYMSSETREKTLAVLRLNISALDRFLHLKNPLSIDEVNFISEQIVEEFGRALTFADIHLVIKNVKAGKYGKFYERLSAPDILDWFRKYYDSRLDAAYEFNRQQDAERYASVLSAGAEGDKNLARLGYCITKDADGNLCIRPDTSRNAEIAKKREEHERCLEEEKKKKTDDDNEYMKFRVQYNATHTIDGELKEETQT